MCVIDLRVYVWGQSSYIEITMERARCLFLKTHVMRLFAISSSYQNTCICVANLLPKRMSPYTCLSVPKYPSLCEQWREFHVCTTQCNKPVCSSPSRRSVKSVAASIVDNTPLSIQPYMKLMRIDRPIGSWLLFWPCGWSIAMAASSNAFLDFKSLALCGFGAFIMRGAGCTINDMWDKDIDSKVARTKDRPLVSGAVSMKDALIFLSGQLGLGLIVLLQFNWYTILLGASSMGLVVLYPLMKRVIHWPQLVLGMTFNWGALLGWSAVHGSCNWTVCAPLYAAGVSWTIIYDTIYAHQDKADDLLLGIKSTAIKFGDHTKQWLSGFACTMLGGLVLAGISSQQTWPYYAAVGVASLHISNQILTLDVNNPSDCSSKFVSNKHVGLLLFCGIVASYLLKLNENKSRKESGNISETKVQLNIC
ncbi:hypothetical protein R5R35_001003 [Gryllus longicercus]|uniref:4-hydroxybenzoate polyprenyltransferase, mitochondrial n=1 Tax=Gryllus longicercus TaxID=2509291 RepID=A0AAN9VY11_9ORTH